KLPGEELIDHHHWNRSFGVRVTEEASLQQGNSHRVAIIRLRKVKQRPIHLRVGGRFGFPGEPERKFRVSVHGKSVAFQRRCLDARSVSDGIVQLMQSGTDLWRVRHKTWRHGDVELEYVMRVETGIHSQQDDKAADHQS